MTDQRPHIFRTATRLAAVLLVVGCCAGVLGGTLGGCAASRSSEWAQTAPAIPPVRHARTKAPAESLAGQAAAGAWTDSASFAMPTASPARN